MQEILVFSKRYQIILLLRQMSLRFMTRLREIKYMLKPDCFQWLLLRHYIIMELEVVFSKMANTIRKIKIQGNLQKHSGERAYYFVCCNWIL